VSLEGNGRRGIGGLIFLQNIKPSSFEELKIVLEKDFESLYEFFKFSICCYYILKIKDILITSINLSL